MNQPVNPQPPQVPQPTPVNPKKQQMGWTGSDDIAR